MLIYYTPSLPSSKTLLIRRNIKQLRHFKLTPCEENKTETLAIWPPSRVPGVLRHHKVEYKKTRYSNSIDLIFKEDEFDSFQWHIKSPDHLKAAVRWGIVKTQSVTGQVIAALGQYRLITLERVKNGFVSNRYCLKEILVNHYQDRFEALQKIESLANSNSDRGILEKTIKKYQEQLIKLKEKLNLTENKNFLEINDPDAILHLQNEIEADRKAAQRFLDNTKNQSFERATGIDSALTFVKTQMIRGLRQLQNHNQNITYSRKTAFAMTRGDLNSCIEDAEKIIEDYIAWPHDVVGIDHQGYYKDEHPITYDSSYHCSSSRDEQRALLAISFIEKQNEMVLIDKENPKIKITNQYVYLESIKATKWYVGGGWPVVFAAPFIWIANIAIKLVVGLVELPLTLFVEPITFGYLKPFFNQVREIATYEISINNPQAPKLLNDELVEKTLRKPQTLGLRIKHFAIIAFKNTFEDIFYGIRDVYKQFSVHLFDNVLNDFQEGKKLPLLKDVITSCDQEIATIAKGTEELEKILPRQAETKQMTAEGKFVEPVFTTHTGEFDDILNAGVEGLEKFVALYSHNIYAKHPFTSVLFSFSYIVGGLAVLAPHSVAFLGSHYIAYSQAMGHSMSKGSFTAAISSGITQAQMSSSAFELLMNGHDSWFVKGAREFERDPFTSLCYIGTALGLGYALLHMPAIDHVLKEDMGTFPPSSLVFVGAKLGILVYELLMEHEEVELEKTASANKLKAYLRKMYQSEKDVAIREKWVNDIFAKIITVGNIQSLRETLEDNKLKIREGFVGHEEMVSKLHSQSKLLNYLLSHQQQLPYLSAKTKYQWARQLKCHFSRNEAESLIKLLYPENPKSILRTTLKVVLSYPVFFLRVLAAVGSSLLVKNLNPLRMACSEFGLKILKDVTRLGRVINKFAKIFFSFTRRLAKTFADVIVNSLLARGQALLANSHSIGNAGYVLSASVDVNYEKARQLFSTPVDAAVKIVTTQHPININNKLMISYVWLLKKMLVTNNLVVTQPSPSGEAPASIGPLSNLSDQSGPSQTVSPLSRQRMSFSNS